MNACNNFKPRAQLAVQFFQMKIPLIKPIKNLWRLWTTGMPNIRIQYSALNPIQTLLKCATAEQRNAVAKIPSIMYMAIRQRIPTPYTSQIVLKAC